MISSKTPVNLADNSQRPTQNLGKMAIKSTRIVHIRWPAGSSRLETLPAELLNVITDDLVLETDLDHTGARSRTAYKDGLSNLGRLCSVSKCLDTKIRPIMLRKVSIYRSIELIRLYRTLTENPMLGGYIRQLVLATPFSRQEIEYEMLHFHVLHGVDSDFDFSQPHASGSMTTRMENKLRFDLYLKVLNKAPNVTKVAIDALSWSVRGLNDKQLALFRAASDMLDNLAEMPETPLLQMPEDVKTVNINGPVRGLVEALPSQLAKIWSQTSKLETLVWTRDDSAWFDNLPSRSLELEGTGPKRMCTSLTTLKLLVSACRLCDIATVCDSFPFLKRLQIVQNTSRDDFNKEDLRNSMPYTEQVSLTSSIASLRQLEALHLDPLAAPENAQVLGDDGALNLSSLPNLSEVTVSFGLFVAEKPFKSTGSKAHPCLVLPQSLTRLTISARGFVREAGITLMQFLEDLRAACCYQFPHLKQIVYIYSAKLPAMGPEPVCLCGRIPHESFCPYDSEAGLSIDYLPWISADSFAALVTEFRQRGIQLIMKKRNACDSGATYGTNDAIFG
ncbi:hypothetical protein J7T55_010679 [Diaporthe amygdali]|uniref:uncharacterized protein n=1 Tax=Phomopsis amygdali TaxID=1214568 RepID=UPI0022FDB266|nr:uncharacterized protein J7T55_010679 [Diaporthe amygdali]KAJ0114290.1 hypothetical protein J7T55_010679 [Diaporthe amygdali]